MWRALRGAPDYPKRLDGLGARAPKAIYYRGRVWSPEPRSVGIVGSRRASEQGRAFAHQLARILSDAGVAVVSGGALGIDGAAHRGALDGAGRTLVVLPTPCDDPAPRRHLPLFEAVMNSGGTLLSEYAHRAGRHTFLERNRIVAALSDVLVLVEAQIRSGTRHTAAQALALERPVLVKQWPLSDPRGHGGRALVGTAGVEAIVTAEEVAALVEGNNVAPPPARRPSPEKTDQGPSDPSERPLWELLETPQTLETLATKLNRTFPSLTLNLLRWEIEGRVERAGGRWRRRVS